MSIIYEYFNYYVYGVDNSESDKNKEIVEKSEKSEKKYLITLDDLKSVNLTPIDNIIPSPARNMPPKYDKVNLRALNKAQLQEILNVKLKPTKIRDTILFFEPRHPVINELYHKFKFNKQI